MFKDILEVDRNWPIETIVLVIADMIYPILLVVFYKVPFTLQEQRQQNKFEI